MTHNDLDKLILATFLIDGEVFIRIHKPHSQRIPLSFEIIDAHSIDYTKNRERTGSLNAIINGVEVDRYYKPVAYHYRTGNTTSYLAGYSEVIPATDIIHIFKKEFPEQVRGIPALNCCLDSLKQLDDYAVAELMAAKVSAILGLFYERNSSPQTGDFMNQGDDDNGTFIQSIEPGMVSIVPQGYSVKNVNSSHPNQGFGTFQKAILKRLAASLGVSYNSLVKDYEAVNYSSLREAAIDAKEYFQDLQNYLIAQWKDIEYKLFLQALVQTDLTGLTPTKIFDALRSYTWVTAKRQYFDPGKDILATERELRLGLKSPLMVMQEDGNDPIEIAKSWKLYNDLCEKYNLKFNVGEESPLPPVEEKNEEENEEQELNSARI